MPNIELLEKSMPVAPIRIAALEGCRELAEEVDRNLVKFRKELVEKKGLDNVPQGYSEDSFIVECEVRVRYGEGKGIIKESVRGTDLYIMVDVPTTVPHTLSAVTRTTCLRITIFRI